MQDGPERSPCWQHRMSLNGREGMPGIADQHEGRREKPAWSRCRRFRRAARRSTSRPKGRRTFMNGSPAHCGSEDCRRKPAKVKPKPGQVSCELIARYFEKHQTSADRGSVKALARRQKSPGGLDAVCGWTAKKAARSPYHRYDGIIPDKPSLRIENSPDNRAFRLPWRPSHSLS